jgi:hypothetical protein
VCAEVSSGIGRCASGWGSFEKSSDVGGAGAAAADCERSIGEDCEDATGNGADGAAVLAEAAAPGARAGAGCGAKAIGTGTKPSAASTSGSTSALWSTGGASFVSAEGEAGASVACAGAAVAICGVASTAEVGCLTALVKFFSADLS